MGFIIYVVGTFAVIGILMAVYYVTAGLAEHYFYRKHNGWMSTNHVEQAEKIGAVAVITLIHAVPLVAYAAVTIF